MDFIKEIEAVFDNHTGRKLAEIYTDRIDGFLSEVFNSFETDIPTALIAIGGYGRRELAPFSDIDIMFFAKDKADKKKIEKVLYFLWDSGLTISSCFRTAEDCIIESQKDIRTFTSLLEARFIAGNEKLYDFYNKEVYEYLISRKQKYFVREKLKEMNQRHKNFGDSVFLLEPNVKEGIGGLRDIHTAMWLSLVISKQKGIEALSAALSKHEYLSLLRAYNFLIKVRFCLHLINKRKNEILSLNMHDIVAEKLGFKNKGNFSNAEKFMRYFYFNTNAAKNITASFIENLSRDFLPLSQKMFLPWKNKISDNFYVSKGEIISAEKDLASDSIMEAFYAFSKTGKRFSRNLKQAIRKNLAVIDKKSGSSSKTAGLFMKILKGQRIYETLKNMHQSGALGRFIPEFGALRSLVIYEPYHKYTVDEHTLVAVRNLENLTRPEPKSLEHFSGIFRKIKDREFLFMAVLFHDIGKAAGRHHKEEGYKRLKNIVERFNLDIEKRQRIEFLVKNHTLMSSLALTREIEDPEIIAQFAGTVGDEENLNAIYLMTYADMSAVNPRFLTEWKAYLLKEFYDRTLAYIQGVRLDPKAYIEKALSNYSGNHRENLRDFLLQMPERYVISTSMEKIYSDHAMLRKLKNDKIVVSINNKANYVTEITVVTWDKPGLFSRIVGFISSKWLNILSAQLYTGKNGAVIDRIQISNWKDLWWDGMDEAIEEGLRTAVIDEVTINLSGISKEIGSKFDVFVETDNESSEENTIVEFFSSDRLGLLYDVSDFFYKKGFNIVSAKIHTESGVALDIFYIQDNGQKLSGEKTEDLTRYLWELLKNQNK